MSNNHLTYFKVENFKKFDSLEVNDIGQFNLIVGDNNVGKTCFLEALLFDEDAHQLLNNFYIGLTKRGFTFQIEEVTKTVNKVSTTETIYPQENYFCSYFLRESSNNLIFSFNKKYIEISCNKNLIDTFGMVNNYNSAIKYDDFISQHITISKDKKIDIDKFDNKTIWIYNYDDKVLNFPLISFNDTPLEEETIKIYETLKTKQEKEILINSLKVINDKIVGVDFRGNFNDLKSVFLISYEDKDDFFPLNNMGDGFKRIFYIILKTISLKSKRIMIDEIEIGIHHSKILEFWKNIFKVCAELDVQLFATTHSEECTEAFVTASAEIGNTDEVRLIKLEESTNKDKVYASTFNHRQIQAGLNSNVELRGY